MGDIEVEAKAPGGSPNNLILEAAIEATTSQSDGGVGATDRPEHAGLFQTGADDSLAAGFNPTGTNEQMLTAELSVSCARHFD